MDGLGEDDARTPENAQPPGRCRRITAPGICLALQGGIFEDSIRALNIEAA
jgi:hypothetical protein